MIELRGIDGRKYYLAPSAIARVTEAGVSSQWHGVRSIVRTFEGETLEVSETPEEIARQVREARS